MFVKRFYEPQVAQASYLIGCAAAGEAIVIDPNRDVDEYIRAAAQENLRIAHVTETHIHADYVSGARELARRTGATLYLSDEGDKDWKYQFAREGRLIRHGDHIALGNIRVDVVHTPGHTPGSACLRFRERDGKISLLVGDVAFPGGRLGFINGPGFDLPAWKASIKRLISAKPDRYYPGHNNFILGGATEDLKVTDAKMTAPWTTIVTSEG